MIELKFTEGTTVIDASSFIIDFGSIERRTETENAHEPGLITFGSVRVELSLKGAEIKTLFSEANLDTHLNVYGVPIDFIKANIRRKIGGTWVQMFSGVVDYETVEWNDNAETASFEIVDILMSMKFLPKQTVRIELDMLPLRDSEAYLLHFKHFENGDMRVYSRVTTALDGYISQDEQVLYAGEIIKTPFDDFNEEVWDGSYTLIKKAYRVWDDDLDVYYTQMEVITTYPTNTSHLMYNNKFYSNEFLGHDIGVYISILGQGPRLDNYSLTEILKAIVESLLGPSTFDLSEEYILFPVEAYPMLVTSTLDRHPVDALKLIAQLINSYIYIDKSGTIVTKSFSEITGQTAKVLDKSLITDTNRKYFWNKIVDEVRLGGKIITTTGIETIAEDIVATRDANMQERNTLKRDIIVYDEYGGDPEAKGVEQANNLLSWYGERRKQVNLHLPLNLTTVEYDLTDKITINSESFFVMAVTINSDESIDMELVKL